MLSRYISDPSYERLGFALESSEPDHSFGHDLVGQYWRLELGER